ncbi:flavodoxin domain-containing protein [Halopiger xanaduensis]|uniref:Flavodoxin/nitric oxide synthase n=1 Tax=Halopiger xanaduensis (strain DSM 18323 / JCM 14033 / SH-6) TaxID=797210 RepID=F8DEB0_HALXS|nr:flavodoxin domain-containing protein [Halopiger xanaduensis]AEH39392.1 flavodoxin/nitric oxide synthase [Halopiger xanaduensis SH-6]
MSVILVIYATGEGQTATVAERIAAVFEDLGHDTSTMNINDRPADLALREYDAVLVGASIHAGQQQSAIVGFARSNRDVLSTRPTAFFQVSLASATEEGRAQAATYVEEFIEKTDWHPDRIGLFGGALRYSKYGFLKRLMMKQIAKRTMSDMPELETSGDVEFTDWNEVEAFAADVAAFVDGRLAVTSPTTNETETDE